MDKFKAGDKVRIVQRVLHETGWQNGWSERMDEFVGGGRIYTVRHSSEMGYFLDGYADPNTFDYGWPCGSLKKAEYDLFDIEEVNHV